MAKTFIVGFSYNFDRTRKEWEAEFDTLKTLIGIKKALEELGHRVICLVADKNFYAKLLQFKDEIDIVFNIAEGFSGNSRESIFPIFFELLDIPYTGSGPDTLSITLNKDATKKICKVHGISTPSFQTFSNLKELKDFDLKFPVIVKPVHEGTSIGISNDSYVENLNDLKRKIRNINENYNQEAEVEEFINGREFTVGILGNDPYIILPPVEQDFSYLPSHIHPFYSYEVKTKYDRPEYTICPAKITKEEEDKLKKIANKAYKITKTRDFGRCDMRMDDQGNVYLLEINPLCGISGDLIENHEFTKSAISHGFTYTEMINEILNNALKRYDMFNE